MAACMTAQRLQTRALGAAALVAATTTALSTALPAPVQAQSAERPNIIIVLADDLGNADLGYRGSRIRTPHLDVLSQQVGQ